MTSNAIGLAAPTTRDTHSLRRLAGLAALALLTALPTMFIMVLVNDRWSRSGDVQASIAANWGPAQTIWGPLLVMPIASEEGTKYLKLAPETLIVKTEILPQQRHRGLFATTVYEATIKIGGHFIIPALDRPVEGSSEPMPTSGYLAIPVTGVDGVSAADEATIGETKSPWQLCRDRLRSASCDGLNILLADADVSARKADALSFSAILHLRGTQSVTIASMAKQMVTTIEGSWTSPSFFGDTLPTRSTLKADGFDAEWRHDEIGRPRLTLSPTAFAFDEPHTKVGVDLIEATPVYRMVMRTAKYSVLVVILAFTTYLLFELVSGIDITVVQYALLGASLSQFTLLLLSISEFIGYGAGYASSAALVLAQASFYTISVTRRVRPACIFTAMLAGLFGFLYILLGLESYALVIGSVALFVLLSIVMAVTQHVHANAPPVMPSGAVSRGEALQAE